MKLKLAWDGSDLGDITKYYLDIAEPLPNMSGSILKLNTKYDKIKCFAWKYKNDLPLIIDELKPIFGLAKIGRHKCTIEGIKILIAKRVDKKENILKKDEGDIDSIRECIVFRQLFGILTNGNCLWYRPGTGVMSYKELTIDHNKTTSQISKININKWFDGDYGLITDTVVILLKNSSEEDYSLTKLTQLARIKINKNMSPIASGFMGRIQTYLSHVTSEDNG